MSSNETVHHWASLEEFSLIWGIRTLVWVYRMFGRKAFRFFLRPVVSYYFLTGIYARNASLDYLCRLTQYYPELGLSSGWWLSYRHFLSFGETLLDKIIAWMGCLDSEQVDFPNRPLLRELVGQKRGALILTGHIGNLELCQALANLHGDVRLNILVHTRHAERFNRLLTRGDSGTEIVRLLQVTEMTPDIAIELQDKIGRGEFVVMVGDRIPVQGARTVKAKFLGAEADFPQGPYLLASLLRCPIYTLFCYSLHGRYQVDLEPFIDAVSIPRAEPQRQQMLEQLAQQYAQTLEAHCRVAPLQWFNFYPYWRSPVDTDSTD